MSAPELKTQAMAVARGALPTGSGLKVIEGTHSIVVVPTYMGLSYSLIHSLILPCTFPVRFPVRMRPDSRLSYSENGALAGSPACLSSTSGAPETRNSLKISLFTGIWFPRLVRTNLRTPPTTYGVGDFISRLAIFAANCTQATSSDYQRFLADHNITSSMSEVGHCGDNAAAEGFFGVIKRERIHRPRYLSLAAARSDVFDCIECFHNPRMQRRIDAQDQKFYALTQQSAKNGVEPRRTSATSGPRRCVA